MPIPERALIPVIKAEELVPRQPRERFIVYLHPSKTGGHSVTTLLRKRGLVCPNHCVASDGGFSRHPYPRDEEEFVSHILRRRDEGVDFIGIEYDWPYLRKGHEVFESFCVFRDPLQRFASFFEKYEPKKLLKWIEDGLEEHMRFPIALRGPAYSNRYVRTILRKSDPHVTMKDVDAAMEIVRQLDHVYIFEQNTWQERIPIDLDLPEGPPMPKRNPRRKSSVTAEIYDLFTRTSKYDIELYRRIVAEFGE